jgi:hypothetical protein
MSFPFTTWGDYFPMSDGMAMASECSETRAESQQAPVI